MIKNHTIFNFDFVVLCKVLFFTLFFLPFLLFPAENKVTLPADMPLFSSPNIETAPFFVTDGPLEAELLETARQRIEKHPLARKVGIWKLSVRGNTCYCAPQLRAEKTFRTDQPQAVFLKYRFLPDPLRIVPGSVLLILACGTILFYFKQKEFPGRKYLLPAALLLIQTGYLLYLTGKATVVPRPADELCYFAEAKGIAECNFEGPWRYTVGWPIIEGIFVFLFHFKDFFEAEDFLLILNGFVVMNGVLLCAYAILLHLSHSEGKAFFSLFMWQLLSIFWTFRDYWHSDPARWSENICKGVFSLPDCAQSYRTYLQTTSFGYNALSDTLSMLCVFILILCALKMKPKLINLIFFGAFYGFTCLVRLNNMMFAFLFLFLLWKKYDVHWKEWKRNLLLLTAGVLSFLTIFSLQLMINRLHFGSIFILPYSLHAPEVAKGFLFSSYLYGVPFLIKANYVYFMPGLVFLLFTKDRYLKTVFFLWIVPLTLFFFGYPQNYNNAIRFLLPVFPALCAVCVFSADRNFAETKKQQIFLLIFFSVLLLTTPSNYTWEKLLAWDLQNISCGLMVARLLNILMPVLGILFAWIAFRNEKKMLFFSVFLLLSYASGCVWLVLPLIAVSAVSLIVPERLLPFNSGRGLPPAPGQ